MRDDIAKLICERQRIGSDEKSVKTSLKLDPNLDYDSLDFDWGPTYVSSSRHRQEGRCNPVAVNMGRKKSPCRYKKPNENLRPLYQFLEKAVGRVWNDVYSEIRQNINPSKTIHYHVLQHVGWHVDVNGTGAYSWRRYGGGLYVNDDGILCKADSFRYVRPKDPVTSLHWYDDVWFRLEVLKSYAKCGCVHFKVPSHPDTGLKFGRWRNRYDEPAVCIHGNPPIERPIWYVVEFDYHQPDEVFQIHRYEDGEYTRARYGLKAPGDKHIFYYRDYPDLMNKPIEIRKQTANRKHLKMIRKAIEAAEKAAR